MSHKLKNKKKRPVSLITHDSPKLAISEQYRLIRTNIQFSAVDLEIKTIMITSAESADGKSTTAANLAIVLAQQGKKVILVDADLRKPSIHYAFDLSNLYGLTDVLTRNISLEEAISRTYVPNLSILTSGPTPPNPSELLDSNAMKKVMEELKERFDYIIFDTPPVLAVTDPQIIANKCDGVVLVIASGKTNKYRAIKAKELLENAKSRILGVIINGMNNKYSEYYIQYS